MLNMNELEREWKRYKAKKRRVYWIGAVIVTLLGAGAYVGSKESMLNMITHEAPISKTLNHEVATPIVSVSKMLVNEACTTLQSNKKEKPKHIEEPALSNDVTNYEPLIPTLPELEEITPQKNITKSIHTSHKKIKHPYVAPIQKPKKKMHLNIIQSSNEHDYHELEKRFKQFHDPDDSLFLARVYYKKGAYKQAISWAYKTNKLNNTLEDAWLIYAKSNVKLGKIDDAIHILSSYIQQSGSTKAKILLSKIKK